VEEEEEEGGGTSRPESEANTNAGADKAFPKLKPRDFYTVLQDDPMLAVELQTQSALLDFVAGGAPQEGGGESSSRCWPRRKDTSSAKAAVLPSESMVKAFVFVAKPKLRKSALAYRAIYAQQESLTSSVMSAFDTADRGYVSARSLREYLQEHANLATLSTDDICCVLDSEHDTIMDDQSAPNNGTQGAPVVHGPLLNQEALRQFLTF